MMGRDDKREPQPGDTAEAGDARGGYLGFVAHEIRNPLSTALWTAEMLARMSTADRGGARGEKLSAMCLRSIARVRQLVEDHLLCERLDAGGLPQRVEAVGAREAIDAVLERRPAETVSARADAALAVEGDRGLLERAIEALVALAGCERTPVTIDVRGTEGEVTIIVKGRPANAAAMADPIKGSPSDPSGRALAAPLARRIAAALGGTLSVQGGSWLLTVRRARAYTPRPDTAATP